MFTTDTSSTIGALHRRHGLPNQDYALTEVFAPERAFAIVADGCSSGGATDTGARLMALALRRSLMSLAPSGTSAAHVAALRDAYLEGAVSLLAIPPADLLATCLWALATPSSVTVQVVGDGVVVWSYERGLVIERFTWDQNMPYYPAYRLIGQDASFRSAQSQSAAPLSQHTTVLNSTGIVQAMTTSVFRVDEGMAGIVLERGHEDEQHDLGRLATVSLFSDGIDQIEGVPHNKAVRALSVFPSTEGRFVARRMNRFLDRTLKMGVGPLDDLSCATIARVTSAT